MKTILTTQYDDTKVVFDIVCNDEYDVVALLYTAAQIFKMVSEHLNVHVDDIIDDVVDMLSDIKPINTMVQ